MTNESRQSPSRSRGRCQSSREKAVMGTSCRKSNRRNSQTLNLNLRSPSFYFYVVLSLLWILVAIVTTTAVGVVSALPDGFIAELVSHANAVTGIFAPNPRSANSKPMLLLVAKEGQVKVIEDPDTHDPSGQNEDAMQILTIKDYICRNTERGLQSIIISPNFETNRYVYLFYTKFKEGCFVYEDEDETNLNLDPNGNNPWNVVERFTMDETTLMLDYDSRVQIWRGAPLHADIHNGGAMAFARDSGKWYLYITTGDSGDNTNGQDLTNLHGNLLRIHEDGSIPDDNPYVNRADIDSYRCGTDERKGSVPANLREAVCGEIYASGFRNPFRMTLHPDFVENDKVLMAISDVGASTWEEISYAGTDYVGVNYGYKVYEGPCRRFSTTDCPEMEAGFQEPFHYYQHREDRSGCVSGSTFVPKDIGWPSKYDFLFADFVWREIYYLTEDNEYACRDCLPPRSKYRNETFFETEKPAEDSTKNKNLGKIVDLFFGPYKDTQALFVVTFGNLNTVTRIRYTGNTNDPPIAKIKVTNQVKDVDNDIVVPFDVGEEVKFDGSGSSDPEGLSLDYQWDFGDGSKASIQKRPIHVYGTPGEYLVTLSVEDSAGQVQTTTTTVVVGTRPVAVIIEPTPGEKFSVGEVLRLYGEAFHTDGTPFPDDELIWEVRKHHDDHWHPFLDATNGNDFDLSPGPKPEDFYASTNSYLEVILTVLDEDGVSGSATEIVWPKLVTVGLITDPPGLTILADEEPLETSINITSWDKHELKLQANDQDTWQFEEWSDGVKTKFREVKLSQKWSSFTAKFCIQNGALCNDDDDICCSGFCFEGGCVV
eukprot:CAMPEP_0113491608 /NCGR_PEP_ID=MMETSP0014_2-20120614/27642_1 /TAXON_ID=2857 /ORGANISM="Nitzschia sp." /LENGTH=824 /DNA_ID=CAMNT_0000385401 /DNA_START=99 /DNA_END=2569 /DNA_ORIENTATION=+ /assembly_acc=CAM_ASM_000159